jgi:hypothetical protein
LESALRIYSNRERRQHLGPRALERLKCASIADAEVVGTLAPEHNSPSEHLIKESISEYSRLFSTLLEGPVAPKSAPIPDDLERRAENLKASAYFLDATLAGCCLLGETDWFGKSNGGMRRAMMAWIAEQSGGRLHELERGYYCLAQWTTRRPFAASPASGTCGPLHL